MKGKKIAELRKGKGFTESQTIEGGWLESHKMEENSAGNEEISGQRKQKPK